jgi:hypothetical protein
MAEYGQANLAAQRYEWLKRDDHPELRQQHSQAGSIPRAIFDEFYGSSAAMAALPLTGAAEPRLRQGAHKAGQTRCETPMSSERGSAPCVRGASQ